MEALDWVKGRQSKVSYTLKVQIFIQTLNKFLRYQSAKSVMSNHTGLEKFLGVGKFDYFDTNLYTNV